jgi:hypothetical protein
VRRKKREYEIYLPSKQRDGKQIKPKEIAKVKEKLKSAFGGYTEINCCEGAWQRDGEESRDEITIVRVLDDGTSGFDMKAFQRSVERSLKQERLLITLREVDTL